MWSLLLFAWYPLQTVSFKTWWVQFMYIFLLLLVIWSFFLRNHSLSQGYIPHANFPMSCIILVITLSSLIYFESIIYIWRDVGVQFHAFSWGYPVVLVLFVESIIISFIELLWHPCQKSIDWKCKNLFCDSSLHSLELCVCTYMLEPHSLVGSCPGTHALTRKLKWLLVCPQLRLSINCIPCSRWVHDCHSPFYS